MAKTGQGAPNKSGQIQGEATGSDSEESAISSDASVLGHPVTSNGSHANGFDNFDASPNRDPAMVVRTLSEAGRQIVFEAGEYRHPSGLPVYSIAWVEEEMRALLKGGVA